ncbi:uncharacterized protein LY89DRAFT_241358 [Mollisia scopiformis]|uniref:Uncharacterized protein n=1 Tax=Mollisia scopiformis TaxID=149040 RepID=A0A194WTI8_MOLSC|nr:uncharacterized protein LY89DRAFT_241358 [Mollisia scopiformis]KUJ11276.1 hypothetical protein LY89DRAFT_241358 [Mollisia scopiformis]
MDISYDELKENNEQLRTEINQYRIQLAELHHKDYQVPDGSIRDELQSICRAIDTWISYASDGQGDRVRKRFKLAIENEENDARLSDLGLQPERPATSDAKLKEFKCLGELQDFILTLVIGRCIFTSILAQVYPVGITEEQLRSTVCQWKSDTLKAFCASESFSKMHNKALLEYEQDLMLDLIYWLGEDRFGAYKDRLKESVFDPAVKLHLDMRCSSREYEVIWMPENPKLDATIVQELAHTWTLKDISSWRPVSSLDPDHGLHWLFPGLTSIGTEDGEKLELVKPVMVVYKRPPPLQSKRSLPPSTSSSPGPNETSSGQHTKDSTPKHYKASKDTSSGASKQGFMSRAASNLSSILSPTPSRKPEETRPPPKRTDTGASSTRRPSHDPSREARRKTPMHPDEEAHPSDPYQGYSRSSDQEAPASPSYQGQYPFHSDHASYSTHVPLSSEPLELDYTYVDPEEMQRMYYRKGYQSASVRHSPAHGNEYGSGGHYQSPGPS